MLLTLTSAGIPYQTTWEHLQDELHRLRMRIVRRLRSKGRRLQDVGRNGLQGLVISEDEIATLLRELDRTNDDHGAVDGDDWAAPLSAIDARIGARKAASARETIRLPLSQLCDVFNLSPFEEQCLVIAAAPELDVRYEKIYAFLQDDVTKKKPTVGLMIDLLCDTAEEALDARRLFASRAPLNKYHFVRSDKIGRASCRERV